MVVLDGYLVDVSAFVHEHPGGKAVLETGYGGRD